MYLFNSMFKLWCALSSQTALFEDVVMHLIAKMRIVFYFCCRENNGAHFHFARTGRNMWFKICINRDLNLVPEINMCKGGEKKQLSGGNQKWSMKLMKQQCHRLIQLSFQFPWQSSVIVPTIFSAEKFLWNCYQFTRGSIASGSSMHCYSKKKRSSLPFTKRSACRDIANKTAHLLDI